MKTLLNAAAVGAMFCLAATTIEAQPGYGRPYDRRDDGRYRREPLDEVRADLDRAARDMRYLSRSEMNRFNKVRQEIADPRSRLPRLVKPELGGHDREALLTRGHAGQPLPLAN